MATPEVSLGDGQAAVIIGADGTVGHRLTQYLRAVGYRVVETTRRADNLSVNRVHLDLSTHSSAWHVPGDAAVAFICAAVVTLEACRRDPLRSARINVAATHELAQILTGQNTFVVVLSSSCVFDGHSPRQRAGDPVSPHSEYGRQKAALELLLRGLGSSVCIARLAKIVPPNYPVFVQWIRDLTVGKPIHPFEGMALAPISLEFAANAVALAGLGHVGGVIQISGDRDLTYVEVALYLARALGAPRSLVRPVDPFEHGILPEHAFKYQTLDDRELHRAVSLCAPNSWAAVNGCLVASRTVPSY